MYSSLIEKINSNSQEWEKVLYEIENSEFIGKITMSEKEKIFLSRIESILENIQYSNVLLKRVVKK